MEPENKASIEYYSKDFDWKTLEMKYQKYFLTKTQDLPENTLFPENYERNWEIFYKINKENFFKDRKYLLKSFEEISRICDKNCTNYKELS